MPLKDKLRSRSAADLRKERDLLGFVRQPAVRWLEPALLARSGIEVIVSSVFGKFADKREIQRDAQEQFDYSASPGELWIDYLSDTGDGWEATYTMAYLAAQPSLEVAATTLPRGQLLLLGGDQVYPTADPESYEDRFKGPFACALPRSEPGHEPHMYALPGQPRLVRRPCQLPAAVLHGRLDRRLEDAPAAQLLRPQAAEQLVGVRDRHPARYLHRRRPAGLLPRAGHRAGRQGDPADGETKLGQGLRRARRAGVVALPVVLRGAADPRHGRPPRDDRHRRPHYARYEPVGAGDGGAPTRITAGGGGAYLSCTHTLAPALELQSLPRQTAAGEQQDQPAVAYTREDRIYPSDKDSRALGKGIVGLVTLAPGLAKLIGGIYALLGIAILGGLNSGTGSLAANATQDGFIGFMASAAGGMSLVVALVLFGAIFGATDLNPPPLEHSAGVRLATKLGRFGIALAQTALHLLLAALVLWIVIKVVPEICDASILLWLVGVPALFLTGAAAGTTIFGLFMFAIHKVRGPKAPENANQVFSGQSIADYKNFLRIRLAPDGGLTVYGLGVDRVGRQWDHVGDGDGPRFVPRREAPAVRLIDGPVQFDPAGNPVS